MDPRQVREPLSAIGGALRVHERQVWTAWHGDGFGVGCFDLWQGQRTAGGDGLPAAPEGRHRLWLFGEVFESNGVSLNDTLHDAPHRDNLADLALAGGWSRIVAMDGAFVVVLWDAAAQTLTIANDRFGSIPLYWASGNEGTVVAAGVRGALAAPGVSLRPDVEAIGECVTFGGFRLGARTNVEQVQMLPGASTLRIGRREPPEVRRQWRWKDIAPVQRRSTADAAHLLSRLWQRAFEVRTRGTARYGQTLSGGLDSRVILAEAARRHLPWVAVTYGLTGCDDQRFAWRSAQVARVPWASWPLYAGGDARWLELRTRHIQATDGLVDLTNLMHLESLDLQTSCMDIAVTGYVGDLVSGGSCDFVHDARSLIRRMPYYGTALGWTASRALAWAEEAIAALAGAPPLFALFEHKLPQSIQRIFQAVDPWVRVRHPFLDHRLFDYCLGLHVAGENRPPIHREWLLESYPQFFRQIPWQKTGMPLGTPWWLLRGASVTRVGFRKAAALLRALGVQAEVRNRAYFDDEQYWSVPQVRKAIEETICRKASICCDVFGTERVKALLSLWFETSRVPTQVIGSLFVYEAYHRDLPAFLRTRRPEVVKAS